MLRFNLKNIVTMLIIVPTYAKITNIRDYISQLAHLLMKLSIEPVNIMMITKRL